MNAIGFAKLLPDLERLESASPPAVRWVRVRNIDLDQVEATRSALMTLRAGGWRTCVLLRRNVANWKVSYLPDDLGESYDLARKLGTTFGELVDAWEIDNEPDLGFVPELAERYTAYLKASYLGLKAGIAELNKRVPGQPGFPDQAGSGPRDPLILMGSLGLPPGPWLERFAANGGFSYTDGFNFHFYGYAPDFSGVYHLHKAAFTELSRDGPASERPFKVFITEIGYGMLGRDSRNTAEGRLAQWRWFKNVGEQLARLRPEAPMAFCLPPYLEYGESEFGLTMPKPTDSRDALGLAKELPTGLPALAEQLPLETWTNAIGKPVGESYATPALAWWWAASPQYNPQEWRAAPTPPSPVVIDFLPGDGLLPVKRYSGHFVTGVPNIPAVKPATPSPPSTVAPSPPPGGEIMPQIRMENGNVFEVYPTRRTTASWQEFFEPARNFGLTFYGRASQPWRFKENRPAALVLLIYPKRLPATFEFRRMQIVRLDGPPGTGTARVGRGSVVVYNFADHRVSGRLILPAGMSLSSQATPEALATLELAPRERRAIPVEIMLPSGAAPSLDAAVTFEQLSPSPGQNRFLTSFLPDPAGLRPRTTASFLPASNAGQPASPTPATPRGIESALTPRISAPDGTRIEHTPSGLVITVDRLEGGRNRSEIVLPWPDGAVLSPDGYLSMEFRETPGN